MQITDDHCSLAVGDDVNLALAAPAARQSIREGEGELAGVAASQLAEVPRLVHALVGVFLSGMFRSGDCLDEIWTDVVFIKAALTPYLGDADELLIQLTGAIVNAAPG